MDENRTLSWNQSWVGDSDDHLDLFSRLEDMDVSADGSPLLRSFICLVYACVCVAGLLSNLLVLVLIRVRAPERKKSDLNFFVLNLALTDLQFALTLPFWAVDTARDFSWPFGDAMCKIVASVTVMNMYASVFFLTAMSVTRYWAVASALETRGGPRACRCSAKWVCACIWTSATLATAPTSIYSTVSDVTGEQLCLLRFPGGQSWLAVYHIQKLLVGFVLPMSTVCASYLMLLRFVRARSMKCAGRRRSRVTRSVTIVVLAFFCCWMPNHAVTLWSVLVKLNVAQWDRTYYLVHTYVFPLTVCLAHTNSCLNPIIYCLTRTEFRRKLKVLLQRG